ncbi:MAG: phenylalanine--tRNA ligase subunit alpha, partial [Microlunatus sp.]|nr:phenylalanine--tRNA ligase subunit alpha [Microlunatus sp.]
MSGPNSSYDPVQVASLSEENVEAMVAEALRAFGEATTVAELKQARIAHAGDRSPLALANREIGALPPEAKREVGQRMGKARGRVSQALREREAEISAAEL